MTRHTTTPTRRLERNWTFAGIAVLAGIGGSAWAVTTAISAEPPTAWVNASPVSLAEFGWGRSPDGSMVFASPVRRSDPGRVLAARLRVRPDGTAARSTFSAGGVARPTSIASTGETVLMLGTGLTNTSGTERLVRAVSSDEVRGPKILTGPAGTLGPLARLDDRTAGALWDSPRDDGPKSRAATIGHARYTVAARPGPAAQFALNPATMTPNDRGELIDPTNALIWRTPGRPANLTDRYAPRTADGASLATRLGGRGAAGPSGAIVLSSTTEATLKEPELDKIGTPVTTGLGDDQLAVLSPSGPAQALAAPVPAEVDAACRANSLGVGTRDLVLSDPWNGPDGAIWAVAGCGRGRDSEIPNAPATVDPDPIRWWLARWDLAAATSSTVPLPDPPAGIRRSVDARGFVMADRAMWIVSGAGTIRMPGFETTATATVQSVRRTSSGRVRLRIACIGRIGDGCFGTATISDGRGVLRRVQYGIDAGPAAVHPIVTREIRAPRRLSGPLSARTAGAAAASTLRR
jgi:hypothetical protein